jgi:putative peptide zinc metalloprotease protein
MNERHSALAAAERPLPVRKRDDLVVVRQQVGRQSRWAVKDPLSLRYYHLRAEEFLILQMLDGRTSVEQIRHGFQQEFAPRRISSDQLLAFLSALHHEGLIVSDTAGQGEQLLQRRRRRDRLAFMHGLLNILAVRLRGVDPQAFLNWLAPKSRWLFAPWFLACVWP